MTMKGGLKMIQPTRHPLMKHMRHLTAGVVGACALGATTVAPAQENPWEFRLRATETEFAQRSDSIPLWNVPDDSLHVDDRWSVDMDARYFFSRHWSGEFTLGYPQSQTLRVEHSTLTGGAAVGSFRMFPTTLSVSYDINPDGMVRPYVGAGMNLTRFSHVDMAVPGAGPLELQKGSIGPALRAGLDVRVAPRWVANMEFKWASVRSEVDLCCARVSEVHLDPFVIGVGLGYRFGNAIDTKGVR
jgi:outer membrane protein